MAYEDPAHVRDNVIKVRLNDIEEDFVRAAARLNQRQTAAFARELLLLGLQKLGEQGNDHARAA
jgi:hypothetical protein